MWKNYFTRPLSGLLIIVVLLFGTPAKANPALQEALDNYRNHRFTVACRQFKTLAEMGFSTAQYNLGVMYLKGQSVAQDLGQAYAWIALAAEQQISFADSADAVLEALPDAAAKSAAQAALASLQQLHGVDAWIDRLLLPVDAEQQHQPFELLQTQAPEYPANALTRYLGGYNMTEFWVFPDGSVRLPSVIYSMPSELFDTATLDAIAQFRLNWTDDSVADPVPTVARQVIDYRITARQKSRPNPQIINHINAIRKRAESGDAYAKYSLAVGHLYLEIRDMDDRQANALLLEAGLAGIPEAQHMVGMRLLSAQQDPTIREQAQLWINMAGLGDYPAITYSVARNGMYDHAEFVFDDISRIELVKRAADMGHAPAVIHRSMQIATAPTLPDQQQLDQARKNLHEISGWYRDEPYWHITAGFVAAAETDFAAAIKHTQKAIRKAAALDWETDDFEQVLARFEQGERMILEPDTQSIELAQLLAATQGMH